MQFELIVGIVTAIILIVFLAYSFLMLKHAIGFRYLSSRTVYLSIAYVIVCTILIILSLISYVLMFFN